MHIVFDKIEEKEMVNFNGGEGKIYMKTALLEGEKLLALRIPKGSSVGTHTHVGTSETEYIAAGVATFVIDGKKEVVKAGEWHYCKNGATHSVANEHDEELVILAVIPEL